MAPLGPQRLRAQLVEVYPEALPQVYDYLVHRLGGDRATAEDLTADTFLRAVASCQRGTVEVVTTAWLITIARNRLTDHWRAQQRRVRLAAEVAADPVASPPDAAWPVSVDDGLIDRALKRLNPLQRAALTLRYVDGLPVAEVAACVGRSIPATETLLARARAAFRREATDSGARKEPT